MLAYDEVRGGLPQGPVRPCTTTHIMQSSYQLHFIPAMMRPIMKNNTQRHLITYGRLSGRSTHLHLA